MTKRRQAQPVVDNTGSRSPPTASNPVTKTITPPPLLYRVHPLWRQLTDTQRQQLLTVDVDILLRSAKNRGSSGSSSAANLLKHTYDSATLVDATRQIVARLQQGANLKSWSWVGTSGCRKFNSEASFLNFITDEHLPEDLREFIPAHGHSSESDGSLSAFTIRMSSLRQRIWDLQQSRKPSLSAVLAIMDIIINALKDEHELLYLSVLQPVMTLVCQALPETQRKTTATELSLEDIPFLPSGMVHSICIWMLKRLTILSYAHDSGADALYQSDDQDTIDVNMPLILTEDGRSITVHPQWLHYFDERTRTEDGSLSEPLAEEAGAVSSVLLWATRTDETIAEYLQEAAKCPLGSHVPTVQQAYDMLLLALQEQQTCSSFVQDAKQHLRELLCSRKASQASTERLAEAWGEISSQEVPPTLGLPLMEHEQRLTHVLLFALRHEQQLAAQQVRRLSVQEQQESFKLDWTKRLVEANNDVHALADTRTARRQKRASELLLTLAGEGCESLLDGSGQRLEGLREDLKRKEIEHAEV